MATQGNSMKVNSSSDGSERSQPSHDTGMSIEKLDGNSNYSTLKFLVELYLIHDDLWEYTQTTPDKTDVVGCRKDQKARAKICLMVKPHCLIHVRNAKTAKEAWDALRSAFEDKGLNNRCRLLTKLVSLKLEQFTSVRSYVTEIMLVAQQLRDIGKEVDDEMLAALMLQGLTETFQPMRLAIENSGVELTTDYIKTKLLQMEDSYNTSSSSSNDIALRVDTHNKTRRFPYKKSQKIKCFICNGPHKARDCPENSKNKKASLALGLATSGKPDEWILDSGASSHMTNSKEYLMDVRMYDKKVEIGCANGSKVYGIGEGSVVCKENVAGVSEVMYVPHLATNLLSVSAIVKKNVVVVFSAKGYELLKADGCKVTGDVLYTGVEDNGVYKLKLCSQEKALASTVSTIDIELWHRRMGHLGVRNLKLLRDKLATGISRHLLRTSLERN
ncbi:hypothetical protein evm_005828 [Chilo suppressalis]|nr:hypothetical protein evm_005828 [Chilo suppressalis]